MAVNRIASNAWCGTARDRRRWPIGIRKAPAPQGLPGYIRIDTVHLGDLDGMKGVYHGPRPAPINAVDIVTQWELVASVEHISEAYLLPVITLLLEGFPFAAYFTPSASKRSSQPLPTSAG